MHFPIKRRVAVVGAGMTLYRRRLQETTKEMVFHAVKMALDSAGLTIKDVDAVVGGSAPDLFDGIHMKGENVITEAGGALKPYLRNFTGGTTGVSQQINAWSIVASGLADVCISVSWEKMSPCHPHPQYAFWTIFDRIIERPLGVNLVWIFALEMNRYMHKHNIKKEDIALVAVKNKANALDHPCAQLPAKITVEDVLNSPVMCWPVQRLDISPPSDGASAVIFASEDVAKKITDTPVWVIGVGRCEDTTYWMNRDLYFPYYAYYAGQQAYSMAHIYNPRKEIDVFEIYDPFDYKELHHMEGLRLCGKGEAPKLTREGVTQRDGDMPVNPSGGLMGVGNPIAAGGGMKVCEIFWQLRKEAGKRQVKKDVTVGLAHAWGELMQGSSVLIMKV